MSAIDRFDCIIKDNYSFTLAIYLFSLQLQKGTYHFLLWRKCSLKVDLKKREFLNGFTNLFSAASLQFFLVKKIFIETRLCNLMTCL